MSNEATCRCPFLVSPAGEVFSKQCCCVFRPCKFTCLHAIYMQTENNNNLLSLSIVVARNNGNKQMRDHALLCLCFYVSVVVTDHFPQVTTFRYLLSFRGQFTVWLTKKKENKWRQWKQAARNKGQLLMRFLKERALVANKRLVRCLKLMSVHAICWPSNDLTCSSSTEAKLGLVSPSQLNIQSEQPKLCLDWSFKFVHANTS